MPLYLVRWPGLVAALVTAADEDDLLDKLDETANPEGCTWSEYRGPVNIEFSLNASYEIGESDESNEMPLRPEQLLLGDVTRICNREAMTATIPESSETADEMVKYILHKAFPSVNSVLETLRETLPESEVREALRVELDVLLKSSWQHAQTKRRKDGASRTAAKMDTSPRLVAHWSKQSQAVEARAQKKPSPPKKPSGTRKRANKKKTKS